MITSNVPVDRISEQAPRVQPSRVLLTMLAAVLYATGWTAARSLSLLWTALVWSAIAVHEGYRDGRKPAARRRPPPPTTTPAHQSSPFGL